MEEEDKVVVEEANLSTFDTIKVSPMSTTSTIGKKPQTSEVEPWVKGGAIMLDPADRTTPFSVDIKANSATMRRSVGKRVRQHS